MAAGFANSKIGKIAFSTFSQLQGAGDEMLTFSQRRSRREQGEKKRPPLWRLLRGVQFYELMGTQKMSKRFNFVNLTRWSQVHFSGQSGSGL